MNTIDKISAFMLILLPIALITGPFIPDLFISLIAIYFTIISIKNKLWSYYRHPVFYYCIIFYIYILVRSILSIDPLLSLESSLFYFRFIFFALGFAFLLDKFSKLKHYFFLSLTLCLFVVTFDAYIQFFFEKNILGMEMLPVDKGSRISGLFGDEYILGSYLSRLMPLFFFYIATLNHSKPWIFLMSMIFLIAVDILIYLSGERTAFFYLLLSTIAIIFLTKKFRYIRVSAFIISIVFLFVINIFFPESTDRMFDKTLEQIGINDQNENLKIFSLEHQDHFTTAWLMFKEKPVFGHGPRLFRKLCHEKKYWTYWGCASHPHNTYLQLLSETGIIGTLLILLIFFYLIYIFCRQAIAINLLPHRYKALNDSDICLYTAFLITLWPFIPTGNFFGNSLNVIYYLPIAFLLRKKII